MTQPPYGDPNQPQSPGPYPGPYPGSGPYPGPGQPYQPDQPYQPGQPGPPYAYPPPVDPYSTTQQPVQPATPPTPYQPSSPGYQLPGQPPPPEYDPNTFGYPDVPPAQPKKRRGLLITAIVLGAALVLCGGGATAAVLLLQDTDGTGADSATAAVNDFLVAVYTDHDVPKAKRLVCSEARNESDLTKKIDEVKQYQAKYRSPKFSWDTPAVSDQKSDSAKVNVKVKMTTEDEKVAEQQLNFIVVKKTGWFVCDVQSG
jgi:hypothetical protein